MIASNSFGRKLLRLDLEHRLAATLQRELQAGKLRDTRIKNGQKALAFYASCVWLTGQLNRNILG